MKDRCVGKCEDVILSKGLWRLSIIGIQLGFIAVFTMSLAYAESRSATAVLRVYVPPIIPQVHENPSFHDIPWQVYEFHQAGIMMDASRKSFHENPIHHPSPMNFVDHWQVDHTNPQHKILERLYYQL